MSYALHTKPIRIESFHDQFRYSPETKNLGAVLLRSAFR